MPPGRRHVGHGVGQTRVRIEQRTLYLGAQQRLMRVLAVNIDQSLGNFAYLLKGRRGTIQIGA